MDTHEVLAAIHPVVWSGTGELECAEAGHPRGHVCLTAADGAALPALLEELSGWYGEPRALVRGGRADPAVTERCGLPLLAPLGQNVIEMQAWAAGGRWIGCGTTRGGDGVRPVVVITERAAPSLDGLPDDASWADRVVAVTGWEADGAYAVDWAAAEARLGTALPSDYKRLAELFGRGAFDGFLQLYLPGDRHRDIVGHSEWLARWAEVHGNRLWQPHWPYPAPGGLLKWADSEQADSFFWLTEGPDPDGWPVLAYEDDGTAYRFDGSTAEFVHRLLTDPRQPLSTARHFRAHWFQRH